LAKIRRNQSINADEQVNFKLATSIYIEEQQRYFKPNVVPNRYYDLQKTARKVINDNVVR